MRIVLAHQGWPSVAAADLAAGHPWPNGSTFKVVTSIEPGAAHLPTFPSFAEALVMAEHVRAEAEADQREVLDSLASRGWSVAGEIAYGRAASNLITQARGFRADLLVVDGQPDSTGAAADWSIVLELLDTAPCPVLVVRRSVISRILLGTDGSAGARLAEAYLVESPALADLPIVVVSVAETAHVIATRVFAPVGRFGSDEIAERRDRHRDFAESAATRLTGSGRDVRALVRSGDVATELASAAALVGADLVVLGSDDRRGLSRILIGSVARDVIARSDASVLIVRAKPDGLTAGAS